MSTDLKGTKNHSLVRFWGGEVRGPQVQVTTRKWAEPSMHTPGFVVMDRDEAMEMVEALMQFVNGTRPVE